MARTITAMINELVKEFSIMWNYRTNTLLEILLYYAIFFGGGFFMTGGELDEQVIVSLWIGYFLWYFAVKAISGVANSISDEASTGTLEQIYMSPVATWVLFMSRVLSTILVSVVQIAVITVVVVLNIGARIPLGVEFLVVLCVTMIGLFGVGLMVGGATLVLKNTTALSGTISNVMLFLNGTIMPVDRFPPWLESVSLLFPTTQGIVVLRKIGIEGESLTSIWSDGSLIYLVGHSVVLLVIGWAVFRYSEHVARSKAILAHY